jgi:peptidoglycan/LPS O-acetylase OafA/YrhL
MAIHTVSLPAIYRRIESWLLSTTEAGPLLRPVMPELDSVRGIAILMVLVFHGFYWYGTMAALPRATQIFLHATWFGRLGVNLFFVLSGFLITGLLLNSVGRADYFRNFYIRRVLRILPAYYVLLLILALTHHTSRVFLEMSAIHLANLTPLFGVGSSYVVLWSLAVEEHFYLIWPTVVRHLTPRRLLCLSGAILIVVPAVRAISYLIVSRHASEWNDVARYTWNAADALALGCFFALAVREFRWGRQTTVRYALGAILGGTIFFCAGIPFGITTRHSNIIGAALQEVPWNFVFVGVLALFLVLGTGKWRILVVPKALRFFGRISYGLYLIHFLMFDAYDAVTTHYFPLLAPSQGRLSLLSIRFLIGSTVAILAAWISRETLEEFFLNRTAWIKLALSR